MQQFESRDITRRNFLKGSALAAAGSILAACAPTAPAEAPAADEAEAAAAPETMGGTLVFGYPTEDQLQRSAGCGAQRRQQELLLDGVDTQCAVDHQRRLHPVDT